MESTKDTLRREMRHRRSLLDAAAVASAGALVLRQLVDFPLYREAEAVLGYLSFDNEVPTEPLIADALARGKAIYLPRVNDLAFARFDGDTTLARDGRGLPEPPGAERYVPDGRPALVLVPLLAWSMAGARLGRGGGWYDRVLPGLRMRAVGVGYESQERVDVPMGPLDVALDFVVTESRLVECGRVLSERRLA